MTLFKFKVQKSLGVMAGWTLVSGLAVLTYELAIAAAAGAGMRGNSQSMSFTHWSLATELTLLDCSLLKSTAGMNSSYWICVRNWLL